MAVVAHISLPAADRCREIRSTGRTRAYAAQVCSCHGAEGGAPTGQANGAWRHGLHTKESVEARRRLNDLARDAKVVLGQLAGGMADEILSKG